MSVPTKPISGPKNGSSLMTIKTSLHNSGSAAVDRKLKNWFDSSDDHIILAVVMGFSILLLLSIINMYRNLEIFKSGYAMARTASVVMPF